MVAQVAEPVVALPASHFNGGFRYFRQGWNNCGPANIAQALSYYGWQGDQDDAASFLKPDSEDKNVSPTELVRFVNTQTAVRALTRIGGTEQMLKQFIAAGFPVIIEVGGALYEGEAWIGHYRTLVGYDDTNGVFLVYDTWLGNGDGNGIAVPYAESDAVWQPFNRIFVVVYEPQRESEVVAILGERADVTRANELALETAREEARANPQNGFAWYNIGAALTRLRQYEQAALAFDEATRFRLPFRMAWYQFYNFEAFFNAGRLSDVLSLVNVNLSNGGNYIEETHYWEGRVLQAQGDIAGARAAFQRALRHNNRFEDARQALDELPGA
jgi:tetratricopeptide (TPR) repeat protein